MALVRNLTPGYLVGSSRVERVVNRSDGITEIEFSDRPRILQPGWKHLCDECGAPGSFDLCPVHRRLEDAPHGYADDEPLGAA